MNTIQPLSAPPPTVRLANGSLVRAQVVNKAPPNRKFLVVLGYHEGDKAACEELAGLIADLERVKNKDADILLFARADATEPSRDIRTKLEAKFERVLFERSRRKDAKGWPWGPNGMFYDMVTLFAQVQPWPSQYYAFVNLETDCVPTRPGWIHELIAGWKAADSNGRACIGFVHNDPKPHLNGVAVYAIDMWSRVGSNKLAGGSPQIPYDIRHADSILPLAEASPLFYFEFQRPTISPDELFADRDGICPAVWHGVKDGSARAAVKARHVTFTEQRELSRQSVMTFYEPSSHTSQLESVALINVWREGWKSRGWNPVMLSGRDAMKQSRFDAFMERVRKLPHVGNTEAHANRFMRWLALARIGGGLMVDYDLIPAGFTPHDLPTGSLAIIDNESGQLCGLRLSREESAAWLDAIEAYDPGPDDLVGDKPCVTDLTIMKKSFETKLADLEIVDAGTYGVGSWESASLVHFSEKAVNKLKPGTRKSVAVDSYLRAKV